MRRIVVFVCLCLAMAPLSARMYQWRNPATGTTQLSGTPPAWYRSADPGPRVYVFDNNQLIDDTGIAVSDVQRDALREAAFGAASASIDTPRDARVDAPARTSAKAVSPAPAALDVDASPAKSAPEAANADKAATLKALIEAWDQRQVDQARALLDNLPTDGKAAPAHP